MFELTGFQRDLLYITAGLNQPSGQQIKSELQEAIGPITHGRLYPNLDTLVTEGYLTKGELNRRTNFYELTDDGWAAIRERRRWEEKYVDLDVGSTA